MDAVPDRVQAPERQSQEWCNKVRLVAGETRGTHVGRASVLEDNWPGRRHKLRAQARPIGNPSEPFPAERL